MLPKNEVLVTLWGAAVQFVTSRYIAILILVGLFIWAHAMVRAFSTRVIKYTATAPAERHWLMLQCIRWERNTAQMRVAAVITLLVGFFIFMIAQMVDDISRVVGVPGGDPNLDLREVLIKIQIAFYFFLMTFKLRALWDATGVYRDLKKLSL